MINSGPYSHRDQLQMQYLMSKHNTATDDVLEIDLLEGYFNRQFEIDKDHDIKRYWEVIDRTSGELVDVTTGSLIEHSEGPNQQC